MIQVVGDTVAEQHNLCPSPSDWDVNADHARGQPQGANDLIPNPLCQNTLLKEVSPWI